MKMQYMQNLFFIGFMVLAGCSRPAKPLEPQDIWQQVSPAVVRVESLLLNGDQVVGSGFICDIEGKKYILTNKHVVRGAKAVKVGVSETNLLAAPGYRISRDLDLAIIDIPEGMPGVCLKTKSDAVKTGEKIYALGFPLGLNKSITQGIISSQTEQLFQFDAPISSGNSGGPLVDADGTVVGIVTLGSAGGDSEVAQNMNFAIKTGIVPRIQLFNDPILSFYKAWLELVKMESRLIDDIRDHQVFELENYLNEKYALDFVAYDSWGGLTNVPAEQKKRLDEYVKTFLDGPESNLKRRYGSIQNAVSQVNSFLLNQVNGFDQVPEIFADIGSDDLLKSFTSNEHTHNYFLWDIKAVDISPLLKASVEFSKAKYEDMAFRIAFLNRAIQKTEKLDAAFTNTMAKLSDSQWVGKRKTTRLAYQSVNEESSDEDWVRMYGLSLQKPPSAAALKQVFGTSLKEVSLAAGGFEMQIASMFEKMAMAPLENGSTDSAIGLMMNEIGLRKCPDLSLMAFFYTCQGNFDKAYAENKKAYESFLKEIDPFTLDNDNSVLLIKLYTDMMNDGKGFTAYKPEIKKNLIEWHGYITQKPAFALQMLPAKDAFDSPDFKKLDEFEKNWVVFMLGTKAIEGGNFEKCKAFLEIIRNDEELNRLYHNCFR